MRANARRSFGAALLDVMLFDGGGWERRRRRGRQRFIRELTAVGWLTLAAVVISQALALVSAMRVGASLREALDGRPAMLLAMAVAIAVALHWIAPLEWRLLESRHARRLAAERRALEARNGGTGEDELRSAVE